MAATNSAGISLASGVYAFNGRLTSGFTATGATVANTGLPLADFLTGRLNSVDATVAPGYGRRIRYYAGYFQDDWRVTPNLTLNLGIRYETETPMFEVAGRMSSFDPWAPNPLAGGAFCSKWDSSAILGGRSYSRTSI